MKTEDVRLKSDEELKTALIDLRKEKFNLRFQQASGQKENTGRVRDVRRIIARIKTVHAARKRSAA